MRPSLLLLLTTCLTLTTSKILLAGSGGCDTDDPTCVDDPNDGFPITVLEYDYDGEGGDVSIEVRGVYNAISQPSWLMKLEYPTTTTSISTTKHIILATETNGDKLYSLQYDSLTSAISEISHVTVGEAPVHIAVATDTRDDYSYCITANYASGSFSVIPINLSTGMLGSSVSYNHTGSGPSSPRQDSSHVHSVFVLPHPNPEFPQSSIVYVTDLGLDKIVWYVLDGDGGDNNNDYYTPMATNVATNETTNETTNPNVILVNGTGGSFSDYSNYAMTKPASGPRHLAFSVFPNPVTQTTTTYVHCICELSSTIETFLIDTSTGGIASPSVSTVSTLPPLTTGFSKASEIVEKDGFVYVTNRGIDDDSTSDGSNTNSIAVYRVEYHDDGGENVGCSLVIVQYVPTNLSFPRGCVVEGNLFVVGGQDSDDVVVYYIREDGTLEEKERGRVDGVVSPVTFTVV
jgi:6-phosphogluconolactonase (cycloisomerase 2 family)